MPSRETLEIRPYSEEDRECVLACIAEFQDFELALEADRLPGAQVAGAHLAYLMEQCADKRGTILVAADDNNVSGFVCVWIDEDFGEHLALPAQAAYVSDLVVSQTRRRNGVGQELMHAAERFAREHAAPLLTVNVLAANRVARAFYAAGGYREYELLLTKRLGGAANVDP
jgi:ribosomal protein S18 acetylase RimI-like enzyme